MAVVAVPLVVIAFVATRRRRAVGEHTPGEDAQERARIEQEFAAAEAYEAEWQAGQGEVPRGAPALVADPTGVAPQTSRLGAGGRHAHFVFVTTGTVSHAAESSPCDGRRQDPRCTQRIPRRADGAQRRRGRRRPSASSCVSRPGRGLEHRTERFLVDRGAPTARATASVLVLAAPETRVAADDAERPIERRVARANGASTASLSHRSESSSAFTRVSSRPPGVGSDVFGAGEIDEEKRRELADVGRRSALGLDADRPRHDVRVALAQKGDMVDAVQKRDHDGIANPLRWREGECRLQRRRLRRHPEDVDGPIELRRGRHFDLEVAEHDALDTNRPPYPQASAAA